MADLVFLQYAMFQILLQPLYFLIHNIMLVLHFCLMNAKRQELRNIRVYNNTYSRCLSRSNRVLR